MHIYRVRRIFLKYNQIYVELVDTRALFMTKNYDLIQYVSTLLLADLSHANSYVRIPYLIVCTLLTTTFICGEFILRLIINNS